MTAKNRARQPAPKQPRTWDAPKSGLVGLQECKQMAEAKIHQRVVLMRDDAGVPEGVPVSFDGERFTEQLDERGK